MPPPDRRPANLTKARTKDHPVAPPGQLPSDAQGVGTIGQRNHRVAQDAKPAEAIATLSARVPTELRDRVKLYAVRQKMSVQALVEDAVRQYLDGE